MYGGFTITVSDIVIRLSKLNQSFNDKRVTSKDSLIQRKSVATIDTGLSLFKQVIKDVKVKVTRG